MLFQCRVLVPLLIWSSQLVGCQAGAMLRQEWLDNQKVQTDLLTASASFPEEWYPDQQVDHFNDSDTRTFRQRYFSNFEHYRPGGPIFINIGGEGPLSVKQVSGYLANALFAEKANGATIAVEHRFYGKTQPFDSLATEHLFYLTSRQALHDLARFQRWFMSKPHVKGSKVFCMGGSYPGSLAAWYRLEFPDLTEGCWSASAPVQAQEVWPGFGQMVWKAVATDWTGATDFAIPAKLYAGYEQIAALIQDPTPETFQKLKNRFHVCPGTLVSQQDRDNLESTVSTAVGTVMQYNNTKMPKLKAVRDIVIKANTPLDAALDVSDFLNLTVGESPDSCTDNSIGAFYNMLLNSTLPENGMANAGRTWTWQTCNEFGYFQMATSVFGRSTMYTRGASSRALWQQVCEDVFDIAAASVSARIAATNAYYGAKNPKDIKRVFFTNGELDAWSLLSVTEYPNNDREVFAEVAPLGSHCVGLYAPMAGEVPGAASIRDRAFKLFQKWGADSEITAFV